MNLRNLIPAGFLLVVCGLAWLTLQSPFWQAVQRVGGVMRLLHEEYVEAEAVDYERLGTAAIEGMVESLDVYSAYLPARDFDRLNQLTEGSYVGIGISIEQLLDRVTVTEVFPDGPAANAGVTPGDQIIRVEDEDMRERTTGEVAQALRGPRGEAVTVEFARPSNGETLTLTIKRGPVQLITVDNISLSPDGIGRLKITQFADGTPAEFREAVAQLETDGMRALIVDLRQNPGGLLRTAKDVAGQFLRPGELIVYVEGRARAERENYYAPDTGQRPAYPIAVLLNENSASGAEIVAGAWQDAGIATVVGETSYGKGSVQSVYAFRRGDGLRQTTARYFLSSGRSIHEVGVEPDIVVEVPMETQMQLLLQARHAERMGAESFHATFEFAPTLIDEQDAAAARQLQALLTGRV